MTISYANQLGSVRSLLIVGLATIVSVLQLDVPLTRAQQLGAETPEKVAMKPVADVEHAQRGGDEIVMANISVRRFFHFDLFFIVLGPAPNVTGETHKYSVRDLPPGTFQLGVHFADVYPDRSGWLPNGDDFKYTKLLHGIRVEGDWYMLGNCQPIGHIGRDLMIVRQGDNKPWVPTGQEQCELFLTMRSDQQKQEPTVESRTATVVLAGGAFRNPSVTDTRPTASTVVDHGVFTRDNVRHKWLKWEHTPLGVHQLDLGEMPIEAGIRHRYHIKGLPAGLLYDLVLGVRSRLNGTGLLTGIRRIHVHLERTDGVTVVSREFAMADWKTEPLTSAYDERYAVKIPNCESVSTFPSHREKEWGEWLWAPNTACGATFKVDKKAEYLLEITILEAADGLEDSDAPPPVRVYIHT